MSSEFYTVYILPYVAIIVKICRAYTDSEEDFEDYYQEVCLQIWRSKDNYKNKSEWSTWVYRIALNVCLTLLKKKKKGSKISLDYQPIEVAENNQAFANESLNELYTAIKKLSSVNRMIILLYLEEKPYKEIAEIIGTTPNNIAVKINRIKEQLKKILNGTFN